jgi:penicillin V acylase-like amidase (Ntn superfamily)
MCTRILWNDNGLAVVVSRTMDWPESTEPKLTVFSRGLERNGRETQTEVENPAKWTSRFGSLGVTIYGIGTGDGMNERGLAAHLLYLKATEFEPRDPKRPGIHAGLWAQYVLDNAETVAEALEYLDRVQLVMTESHGHAATVHLALEDATGDSAIVEYVGGKRVIHHGREYCIMTNDPVFDEQLELLEQQDFSHPSRDLPLPGNVNPVDRFQRAAYFRALLPKPDNERQAVAGVLAIARNVSVPFGAPYGEFGIYNTEYRTAANLTDRRYFFELSDAPSLIWVDLKRLHLNQGDPVRTLDPNDIDLSGDVTERLIPSADFVAGSART